MGQNTESRTWKTLSCSKAFTSCQTEFYQVQSRRCLKFASHPLSFLLFLNYTSCKNVILPHKESLWIYIFHSSICRDADFCMPVHYHTQDDTSPQIQYVSVRIALQTGVKTRRPNKTKTNKPKRADMKYWCNGGSRRRRRGEKSKREPTFFFLCFCPWRERRWRERTKRNELKRPRNIEAVWADGHKWQGEEELEEGGEEWQ